MLGQAAAAQQRRALIAAFVSSGGIVIASLGYNESDRSLLEAKKQTSSVVKQSAAASALTTEKTKIIPTRDEQLNNLTSGKKYDILVVGGGATGSGTALDAATRGLSVALIERGDFGNETSSRSTKLIWAGIRYIATSISALLRFRNMLRPFDAIDDFISEFKMVQNAHKERRILIENNPHLTNWCPIAVPIKSWITWPAPFGHPIFASASFTLPAVFKFYDGMSGFSCPPSHIMGRDRAHRKFPQLNQDMKYFQVFYEGQHNDARTATCIALTAAEQGATIANYVEMIGLIKDKNGKATGVTCKDNLTGKEFEVYAEQVIFAGGPFTDSLRNMEDPNSEPAVNAAAGTHIVLPAYYCPNGIGMLDTNTSDGRFLFFLPWQGATLVGTTDRKGPAVSSHGPPESEIQWLLNETSKYLSPELKVRRSDVLSAWQGFRPLASDPNAPPGAPISRDHIISVNPNTGVTFITGGKWTTYREMAEDVVNRVVGRSPTLSNKVTGPSTTETLPLRGGEGYTRNVSIRLVQEFGVSEETAKHLARTYGVNAFDVCLLTVPTGKRWPRFGRILVEGYPYLDCEVLYAVKNEMVCTVKDMLTLRTRLAFLNRDAAMNAAPKVADIMAKALGWSRKERNRQLKEAEEMIGTFGGSFPNTEERRLSATITDLGTLFSALDVDGSGYIDLIDFKDAVRDLGFPFKNDKEALVAFNEMDTNSDNRISEEEFLDWWYNDKSKSKLRSQLSKEFKFSTDKLGSGSKSRGVMFG